MEKVFNFIKWILRHFFDITIAIFIVVYIYWFRLNPIPLDQGQHGSIATQAAGAFISGILLLLIYGFIISMMKFLKNHPNINAIFLVMAILTLSVNTLFVNTYFPYVVSSAQYGESTYYLTSNYPFLECCGYYQITKWQGRINYESFFYGYNLHEWHSSPKMKEVCFTEDSKHVYITIGQQCKQ